MSPSNEFRLEQVLRHTLRQEEQKQLELRTLTEEERRLHQQLAQLREKEDQQLRALSERSRGRSIDLAELDATLAYLSAIEGSIGEQLDVVADVESKVLDSREQLIEILREKQSLENLKQRQLDAAASEANRRESKEMDDMTSARFVRRAREA